MGKFLNHDSKSNLCVLLNLKVSIKVEGSRYYLGQVRMLAFSFSLKIITSYVCTRFLLHLAMPKSKSQSQCHNQPEDHLCQDLWDLQNLLITRNLTSRSKEVFPTCYHGPIQIPQYSSQLKFSPKKSKFHTTLMPKSQLMIL